MSLGTPPDSTRKDATGQTPMQLALLKRKFDLAQLLLAKGAYHNFRDRDRGPYTMTQQVAPPTPAHPNQEQR